jgi:hypothetical protein
MCPQSRWRFDPRVREIGMVGRCANNIGNGASARGSSLATGSAHLNWLKPSDDERRLSDDRADRKKPSTSTNQYGIRGNVIKVDRRKRSNAIFDATSDAG